MRILFVASEGLPFSKTGGLADVLAGLPKALVALGHEVAVVLPRSRGSVEAARVTPRVVVPSLTIGLGDQLRFPVVLGDMVLDGVQYFLVDDPGYFDREFLYGDAAGDYPDNAERYATLSRTAIEIAKQVWSPDVIHCHDWQAALVPVLLRTVYAGDPALAAVRCVLTVHNLGYHGQFPHAALARIGLPESLFHMDRLEFYGDINYLKGGLIHADYLTTVSRRYAAEIQTREVGHGLDGVLAKRADRLVGILNGADYAEWNPAADPRTVAPFSAEDLAGKRLCRADLLSEYGLPDAAGPVLGMVSRLVDHKGFDLVAGALDALVGLGLTIVLLGSGEARYETAFREFAKRHPKRMGVRIGYDDKLAHKIIAGSDMFLMPSHEEPSGLTQLYSLRYGTVPIVRATGGLDDSIEAHNPPRAVGTGFRFTDYTTDAMIDCVRRARATFDDRPRWRQLQLAGMTKDFAWPRSARAYLEVYDAARALTADQLVQPPALGSADV
ncbi:glycogen synthase GlgA [Luedemannella flava]|uniref:Glycogen synthase n=1 Tax=Luedemannella flava TaxID=349316 RepID=A0ABP4Y779_9ACTN